MTEEAIKEIQRFCRDQHDKINTRLSIGSAKFAAHEERIKSLESDYKNLCRKIDLMNGRVNQIFGSVLVACILLVINIMIGRF